ncbi:geranylgeranyl reductase family protein [Thermocrinis minervae]|uniref:Geranylgeranyl reductase family n=1 Tax=Thermocrinis minervae TaxID=381751 RepID=A0A1M6T368_9AQUI|nr:NAD(P)/FAD-dependent oxidoreductase [Thermocrinis minervae]SHK51374.1 geranylgeranyl reductase family [Thermocrinis minervae]
MKKFDFLVVGGGPAGSTFAYLMAKSGASVLVVDFKRRIGTPVQCAEFVPLQLKYLYEEFFSDGSVVQKVKDMVHYTPWGEVVVMPSEGFVLDREVFDYNIAQLAQSHGAVYSLRTLFLDVEDGYYICQNVDTRETFKVKADVLVGADGARSKVAKLSGQSVRNYLTTAQRTYRLTQPVEDLLVFFRDYIPGGYGWVFPKGNLANVGVGVDVDYKLNPTKVLNLFVNELMSQGLIEGEPVKATGGWIPADGLLDVVRERIALIGDAGGFCHPITGGGIANAVISGSMLARALLEDSLETYEEMAKDIFGDSLSRAASKRKLLKTWENLETLIPKTWIAFREYYAD